MDDRELMKTSRERDAENSDRLWQNKIKSLNERTDAHSGNVKDSPALIGLGGCLLGVIGGLVVTKMVVSSVWTYIFG